jgi:L-arabinose isomerase
MEIIVPFTDLLTRFEIFPDDEIEAAVQRIREMYRFDEAEKTAEKMLKILMDHRNSY